MSKLLALGAVAGITAIAGCGGGGGNTTTPAGAMHFDYASLIYEVKHDASHIKTATFDTAANVVTVQPIGGNGPVYTGYPADSKARLISMFRRAGIPVHVSNGG